MESSQTNSRGMETLSHARIAHRQRLGSLILLSAVTTWFCLLSTARAQPIIIGYAESVAITNATQSQRDSAAQLRWFFAHASVGANIMSGISALHDSSTPRYPLTSVSENDTPPATTRNGIIYEYARGNPSSDEKFSLFATYVTNGWRNPKVHIVLNKLCYIDQDASLQGYLDSMKRLEAAFPETLFVYMTIPLTTSSDSDNYKRNVFNDGVRAWVQTNNLVLFDVADIESHDTTGAGCVFTYNGRSCQKLYSSYSSDGGHLNTTGSKLVASGFYALGAALFTTDRDNDGVSDGAELISGTAPGQRGSTLKMTARLAGNGSLSLSWPGASNRLYSVQRSPNVYFTNNVISLITNTPATPPFNTYMDSPSGTGPFFYRILVHQ
jgi:hypothetical protein